MPIIHSEAANARAAIIRRLVLQRTILDLTQRDLAAHFGDRQSNVAALEGGKRNLHVDTAISYAWAVGLNLTVAADHHMPLLDLSADELDVLINAALSWADTDEDPRLRTALDTLIAAGWRAA